MKSTKFRAGLAILAGGLSFVGGTSAVDLIQNGSFEANGALSFGSAANWTGNFSTYNYSQNYTTPQFLPASENAGNYYSWCQGAAFGLGGWDAFVTPTNEIDHLQFNLQFAGSQTVNLTNAVSGAAIDAGAGRYTFSSWLASYAFSANVEQPYVVLKFSDYAGTTQVGNYVIFDRATNTYAISYAVNFPTNPPPADLATDHDWIKYGVTNVVPVGARKASVYLLRSPKVGKKLAADTYVDLVKLDVINTNDIAPPPPSIVTQPASQTAAYGNSVAFTVSAVGSGTLGYQWRHAGTNLPGSTTSALSLSPVTFAHAGDYSVVVTNIGGATTSSPPATLTVVNPLVLVTGQWDFKNTNLVATCGLDLQFNDLTVQGDTTFDSTTAFGIPDIAGQPTTVMHMVPSGSPWGGYQMYHGAAPNGGGAKVNQYTLVFDIYYPTSGSSGNYGSFLQTTNANNDDGDFFVNPGGGIGVSSSYQGSVSLDAWHRIAFAFSLTTSGAGSVLTKFIDGVKVGEQSPIGARDGRFSLDTFALLLADEDGDTREAYVSSIQFSNGRRPDAFIAALGGPTASKIPGCVTAAIEGGNIVVRWTGGVPLMGADDLTGPWTQVSTSNPYTVPSPAAKKFYRPKIP